MGIVSNIYEKMRLSMKDLVKETVKQEHLNLYKEKAFEKERAILNKYFEYHKSNDGFRLDRHDGKVIVHLWEGNEGNGQWTFEDDETALKYIKGGIVDDFNEKAEGSIFYLTDEELTFLNIQPKIDEVSKTKEVFEIGKEDSVIREDNQKEVTDFRKVELVDEIIQEEEKKQSSSKQDEGILVINDEKEVKKYQQNKQSYFDYLNKQKKLIREKINICEIAEELGFNIEYRQGKKYYYVEGHDSFFMYPKNGHFEWTSRGLKGGAIELWMNEKNVNMNTAIKEISVWYKEKYGESLSKDSEQIINNFKETDTVVELTDVERHKILAKQLHDKNFSSDFNKMMKQTRAYLIKTRQINPEIVDQLIKDGFIYQLSDERSRTYVAFVGRNSEGMISTVCQRTTSSESKFKGDFSSCDYSKGWYYDPYFAKVRNMEEKERIELNSKRTLLVFEAAIDMMSYMSLIKETGKNYKGHVYLSTGSVSKTKSVLETCKTYGYKKVVVMFDNDFDKEVNAGQEAAKKVCKELKANGINAQILYSEKYNDWNDRLIGYHKGDGLINTVNKFAQNHEKKTERRVLSKSKEIDR